MYRKHLHIIAPLLALQVLLGAVGLGIWQHHCLMLEQGEAMLESKSCCEIPPPPTACCEAKASLVQLTPLPDETSKWETSPCCHITTTYHQGITEALTQAPEVHQLWPILAYCGTIFDWAWPQGLTDTLLRGYIADSSPPWLYQGAELILLIGVFRL